MTFNSQLVDEVVRNVMRELSLPQTSSSESTPLTVGQTELAQHVITEHVLAGHVPDGGTISIPVGAVITPSGRDYIQRHRLHVSKTSPASATSTVGVVIVVGELYSVSASAASAGWSVVPASCNFDAANQIAQREANGPVVCCSSKPSVIACLVNRNSRRRAAVVNSQTCLADLLSEMNPDTVCLSACGWSFAELSRVLKDLSSRGETVPAAWKELA
ncbi:MAG: hypothetical protein MK102_10025 [Fuerstiella sp.]|nr:hypothetical protein [Fuerstiella sp.]